MKNGHHEKLPKIPLTALATLCFVTLILCQTRFKISKEMNREVCYDPPVMRSKECWFLYTIGNPDRFKCVLKVFVVITSPMLSLVSTALLLFGKMESNPYFFIPWLFLTIKGLLLIQTDNLITILRDMSLRTNYAFGFRMEDLKWMLFYVTIFMIDRVELNENLRCSLDEWKLVETFSFCEIFDIFLVLWNHQPKYNLQIANIEAVKKDIADIMKSLSKCSLGSLSKISLGSLSESDGTNESIIKELESIGKLSTKEDERSVNPCDQMETPLKNDIGTQFAQNLNRSIIEEEFKIGSSKRINVLKPKSESNANFTGEFEKKAKNKDGDSIGFDFFEASKVKLKTISPLEEKPEETKSEFMHKNNFSVGNVCS